MKTPRLAWAPTAALALLAGAALAAPLSAQIVSTFAFGAPSRAKIQGSDLQVAGKLGVALPPTPHLLLLWNLAGAGFDRFQGHNGAALETGLEAWVSPARRPAQSWGPLLLAEAALGRRFGVGLHGYQALGIGAGWSLGDWVPYLEFRRRASFHAGQPVDHQILIGVHFVLFG
ncbi:MAG TPA: hypothetical protein VNF74_13085 [Terriglobales bacterium]|nr:hypothetical protein [Terriglobales bacterium]